MNIEVHTKQRAVLANDYHLNFHPTEKKYQFKGTDLLEEATFQNVLLLVTKYLELTSPTFVVGSIFSKYYGYLVTTGALYTLGNYNVALDVSLDNIMLETDEDWGPVLHLLTNNSNGEIPHHQRESIREEVVRSVFAKHLGPIFKQLNTYTKVKEELLWANVAFTIHWHYDKWIKEAENEEIRERFKQDFLFVTKHAPSSCFGLEEGNPLDIKLDKIEHPSTGQPFRLRKLCCLRYKLPDCSNCTTCPGINEEERKKLLLK